MKYRSDFKPFKYYAVATSNKSCFCLHCTVVTYCDKHLLSAIYSNHLAENEIDSLMPYNSL